MNRIPFLSESLINEAFKIEPVTKVFEISAEQKLFPNDNEPTPVTLIAAFESRELINEVAAVYHIRFLPLRRFIRQDAGDESEHENQFVPRDFGKFTRHRSPKSADSFVLLVDRISKIVKFGPKDNIKVVNEDLRGIGIGSYAFRELIFWAQSNFPDYDVDPVWVAEVDAFNPVNHMRRNRFYEKHGFKGDFSDVNKTHGFYKIDGVSDLTYSAAAASNWVKKDIPEMLVSLLTLNSESKSSLEKLKEDLQIRSKNSALEYEQLTKLKKQIRRSRMMVGALVLALISVVYYYLGA